MKFNLISLVFLLASTVSFAQMEVGNVKLNFGSDIEAEKGDVVHIAGDRNGVTYTLASQKSHYYLRTFDANSQDYLNDQEVELDKVNGSKVTIEDLAVIDGEVYVFASYYDKKLKQSTFIAYPVNESLELGRHLNVLSVAVPKRSQRGGFFFQPSYDDTKYAVMHVGVFEKEEKLKYEVVLLDKDLKKLQNEAVNIQFNDRKDLEFSLDDFTVNANGDVFVVVSDSYRDKKAKTTKTNLTVHAYYASKGYKKEVIDIDLKGKKVLNCSTINTGDGRLQLIGFYSNLKKSGKAQWGLEGVFDIALNTEDNSIVKEAFNEFTFDTKKKILGERRANKGKDLRPYYRNTHLIERKNGGVIVLSEWYTTFVGKSSGIGPLSVTPITYVTNEIIITALSADGTLDWSNVVPKEQQVTVAQLSIGFAGGASNGGVSVGVGFLFPLAVLGEGPEYLSSVPLYEGEKLSLLVNDDPKNIGTTDMDDVKKVRNVKKMIPVLFTFDDTDGTMERIDPEDYEKKQLVVRPSVTRRLGNGEYLIYATNKDSAHLGSLKIK